MPIEDPDELFDIPSNSEDSLLSKSLPTVNGSSTYLWTSLLRDVQRWTAYGAVSFAAVHWASVGLIPAIAPRPVAQQVFEMARALYLNDVGDMVLGVSVVGHIVLGITLRITRWFYRRQRSMGNGGKSRTKTPIHESELAIGLGGVGSLLGLGYKRSWISQVVPLLNPISLSGYLTIIPLAYHVYKFRLAPILVDGDSNMISLDFVGYYLGLWVNWVMLVGLGFVGTYHFVSGGLWMQRKYGATWKKIGYGVLVGVWTMATVLLIRLLAIEDTAGFIAKTFTRYLSY